MNLKVEQVGRDETMVGNHEDGKDSTTSSYQNTTSTEADQDQVSPMMARISFGSATTTGTSSDAGGSMEFTGGDDITTTSSVTSANYSCGDENENENENSFSRISMLQEEENYPEPDSFQEELNEILEAFYEMVPEEDIQAYQRLVEDIQGARVAELAIQEPEMAPEFTLPDQDGDIVDLKSLLEKGPVVLIFYRGKWCPHCNATLMRYQKHLVPELAKRNATLVALSPMLPDGTAYLASKRDLEFSVCSDIGNVVADQYRITFTVSEHTRPFMSQWGEHVPTHNGSDDWKIPLPATYIIGMDGRIVWSFLDNDPGIRADPKEILEALPPTNASSSSVLTTETIQTSPKTKSPKRLRPKKLFNRTIGYTFSLPNNFGSKNNTATSKEDPMRTSVTSVSSDQGPAARRKRTKPRPKRSQSAREFLGKYMLMGP